LLESDFLEDMRTELFRRRVVGEGFLWGIKRCGFDKEQNEIYRNRKFYKILKFYKKLKTVKKS